jgi:tetratricopeptide (TPR) repeat protein
VVHSFGEFGLFTPAITVLVAALVAQIVASDIWSLKLAPTKAAAPTPLPEPYSLRLGGLAPFGAFALALLVGATLVMEAWRADRQCRYRNAAERLRGGDAEDFEHSITYLQQALRWGPDSAWTQQELGEIYLNGYQNKIDALDLFGSAQAMFSILTPLLRGGPTTLQASAIRVASEPLILRELVPLREAEIEKMYLAPALRCFVQARNLCPLLPRAQLRLVALAPKLAKSDSQTEYLERAKLVAGYDSEFWFMGGAVALAHKQFEDCWQRWKESLAISRRFFKEILAQSRPHLTPSEILEKVLPDNPELIVETANILLPNPSSPADMEARAAYFKRAVPLLRNQTTEPTADGWMARAAVYEELNDDAHAIAALRRAMDKNPAKYEVARIELVKVLVKMGDRAQARRELEGILTKEPWNTEAKRLDKELSGSRP